MAGPQVLPERRVGRRRGCAVVDRDGAVEVGRQNGGRLCVSSKNRE